MSIEVRTDRLRLRPLEPADRTALHRHWIDPDVRRFLWDDRVLDLATLEGGSARGLASLAADGFCLFALRESGGEALIGACGLWRIVPGAEPELLHSLPPRASGR